MLERQNILSSENRPHYCCTFIAVQKSYGTDFFFLNSQSNNAESFSIGGTLDNDGCSQHIQVKIIEVAIIGQKIKSYTSAFILQ